MSDATQGKVHVWIPLLFMGLISIAAAFAYFLLPETLHENLPQTFEDGDAFGRDQSLFSLAKRKGQEDPAVDGVTDLACVMTSLLPGGENEKLRDTQQ